MIYVNGVLTTGYAYPYTITAASPIWIGNDPTNGAVFNSTIDEIRFWTTTRTAAQLAANINTVFNTSTPFLKAYYRFKEPLNSQYVVDESVTKNTGFLGSSQSEDTNDPIRVNLSCSTAGGPSGATSRVSNPVAVNEPLYFSEPDSMKYTNSENSVVLFPNPFENTIQLKITNATKLLDIEVFNSSGQRVYTKQNHPANEELILGDEFPSGFYLMYFVNAPEFKPISFVKIK